MRIRAAGNEPRAAAGDIPARLQLAPLYDPQRLRILDQ